jgi:hypothetical protein
MDVLKFLLLVITNSAGEDQKKEIGKEETSSLCDGVVGKEMEVENHTWRDELFPVAHPWRALDLYAFSMFPYLPLLFLGSKAHYVLSKEAFPFIAR